LFANEDGPRFLSVQVKDELEDGELITRVDFKSIVEGSTGEKSNMILMMVTGLGGPNGPHFNPPFMAYHNDCFLYDGSPTNKSIFKWQMEEFGSPGYPWASSFVLVRMKTQWGSVLVDVTEDDLPGLKLYFSRYVRSTQLHTKRNCFFYVQYYLGRLLTGILRVLMPR